MKERLEGRVFCPECHNEAIGEPHLAAFGFQRVTCRVCQAQVTAPMSRTWRRGYWAAVITLMAVADVFLLRQMTNWGMAFLVLAALAVLPLMRSRQLELVHRIRSRNTWLVELRKTRGPDPDTGALA